MAESRKTLDTAIESMELEEERVYSEKLSGRLKMTSSPTSTDQRQSISNLQVFQLNDKLLEKDQDNLIEQTVITCL
ncbi:hypothetical protein PAAG_11844 [Paracoccidioides lutzii Pb01]|uniref:Uncharacterized protein n=1 Tax=Paracoccidioides lutzii (strain ATCC MYA-826 / Pb01) TaxID=502779 RepID=A0A0A2VKS8_PARBA|nr:hypothetical protein PAAG_11844 [Paracoccidioides lutzii Pb01]KGQ01494.1 hypothetical protein PAAG_11844 [Paracoccidioides lutzii Pb01]